MGMTKFVLVHVERTQNYKKKMTMIPEVFNNIEVSFIISVKPLPKLSL